MSQDAAAAAAFAATADAAQRIAGVVAARHRGDLGDAETLLDGLDDRMRAAGSLLLADLALALLAGEQDRGVDEVASELSLRLASSLPSQP